jgi:hypothetical protein
MSARQSIYVMGIHGGIVFAVVVATVILGVQGTLDPSSTVAILGAAVGFAGGTSSGLGSLTAAVNGKATVPIASLADREQTIRDALAAASSSAAHTTIPSQVPGSHKDEG